MKPYLGISKNLLGIIWPYATTTAMSGFNELKNLNCNILLQIHDELIFESNKSDSKQLINILTNVMTNVVQLLVPLDINIEIGKNLGEMK